MLYTTQKLFEQSGVAPSTCRYWLIKLFSEFAPSQQDKKWPDEALLLIKEIQKLKQQNLDNEEIKETLRKTFTSNAETSKALAPVEFQSEALQHYQKMEELFSAAIVEIQQSNQMTKQLITLLVGKKRPEVSTPAKTTKKPRSKKIVQRVAKSSKRKLKSKTPVKKRGFFARFLGR